MTILKCKMCGGSLEINPGESVAECPYCGTKQTVPNLDDDKKAQLFERANRLRSACMFDRALAAYESIISSFPEEAEAYWGEILCKYGIEYVDDPVTGKKIPTCHRSSYDSILEDESYEFVMEYADQQAKEVYRNEAKQIEAIRRGINEISSKEDPYDIFICYKETDDRGERTEDSVLAQDIYNVLTKDGYRVFFSRISLEDKLGQEYEPYIFAALNSAKVMLVVGTETDRLNSVWVKNEWSRYLNLISKNSDKTLIPCYKGITAYDLPKEFQRLQSQDLGKVGAIQDLTRGIEKIIRPSMSNVTGAAAPSFNIAEQVKRGMIAVEDKEWEKASSYFNKVLDAKAENAESYLGLALIDKKCNSLDSLFELFCPNGTGDLQTITRNLFENEIKEAAEKYEVKGYYSSSEIIQELSGETTYSSYVPFWETKQNTAQDYISSDKYFAKAIRYSTGNTKTTLESFVNQLQEALQTRLDNAKSEEEKTVQEFDQKENEHFNQALVEVQEKSDTCNRKKIKDEELKNAKKKKVRTITISLIVIGIIVALAGFVTVNYIIPSSTRKRAEAAIENKDFDTAITNYEQLGDEGKVLETKYLKAKYLSENQEYDEAIQLLMSLHGYSDSAELANSIASDQVHDLMNKNEYDLATEKAINAPEKTIAKELNLEVARAASHYYLDQKNYEKAIEYAKVLSGEQEYIDLSTYAQYLFGMQEYEAGHYVSAAKKLSGTAIRNVYPDINDILPELFYKAGEESIDDGELVRASEYFEKSQLGDYESRSLEAIYLYAVKLFSAGNYEAAITKFNEVINYSDAREQKIKAEKEYMKLHQYDKTSQKTVIYSTILEDLIANGDAELKEFRNTIYKPEFEVIAANDDINDYETIEPAKRNGTYFHMQIYFKNGDPRKKYKMNHSIVWPDGSVSSKSTWTWDDELVGEYFGVQWEEGVGTVTTGNAKLNVYDYYTGELLGAVPFTISN